MSSVITDPTPIERFQLSPVDLETGKSGLWRNLVFLPTHHWGALSVLNQWDISLIQISIDPYQLPYM